MRYFYDDQLNELAISLLEFSKEKAKEESVFPWMILRKKAIIGICAERPKSIEELLALPIPLSKNTIQKYGKEIVGICYVTERGRLVRALAQAMLNPSWSRMRKHD